MSSVFGVMGVMRLFPSFLLGALILGNSTLAHAASGVTCTRTLTLALHDHGLLYSADTDAGIDKDIAEELIKRSGCSVTVSLLPRARIWQLIEQGGLDFSLSGIADEARNRYASFAWYFSDQFYLLVREDAQVEKLADFAANPALQLGVIRSFRYSPRANELVDTLTAQRRVRHAARLEPLYEVLMANQIQGMIIEPFDYPQVQSEKIRQHTRVVETGDAPTPHGLIMSNKSLSIEERAQWRAIIDAMRADGTVERIFAKYLPAELAHTLVDF
ncbi:substrate-binding periplasmic protein [Pseudomonas turukhanskensis]|uniref:substrate-binding periplasmic protein n=1 Tax=Pseudomonas turukhanskensis TaxID=1806536 RepID=UPI0022F3102A|nr:transporter substrate-binding domain-containing protein [Pseudomonas turukhanskensis]